MSETTTTDPGNITADETLDAYGLLCPMPIIMTAKLVDSMDVGKVLEVVASDEGIKEDMPAWCDSMGHEYLGVREQDGEYRVFLRKSDQRA